MGMDPVKPGEYCEVTIVLEGPVGKQALMTFRTIIDNAIDDIRNTHDAEHGGDKLKSRLTRLIIR